MAGGDIIQLAPRLPVKFNTAGDVLSSAFIFPVFWGPYWLSEKPELTRAQIMNGMQSIVDGSYLDSLKEYGYTGPVTIGAPLVRPFMPPVFAPGPGIDQVAGMSGWMDELIRDNIAQWNPVFHFPADWLIVIAFLDPSIPPLVDGTGKTDRGAHYYYSDPNTDPSEVSFAWVGCSLGLAQALRTFSHELVETISYPVPGAGIIQIGGAGEIGDVCNQPALVNGVNVVAYWSQSANACVIPTATLRSVSLDYVIKQHTPKGGAWGLAPINLGPICGRGIYLWTETTYQNVVAVTADIRGYESAALSWQLNGAAVPVGIGLFNVPATWQNLPSGAVPPLLGDGALPPPHNSSTAIRTFFLPLAEYGGANQLMIDVGPDAGDTAFTVSANAVEIFDTGSPIPGQPPTSLRSAQLNITLVGQQILWEDELQDARKRCAAMLGLKDDPVQGIGPPQPGDPPDLLGMISRILDQGAAASVQEVLNVANHVRTSRPELFTTLVNFAKTLAASGNSFEHQ